MVSVGMKTTHNKDNNEKEIEDDAWPARQLLRENSENQIYDDKTWSETKIFRKIKETLKQENRTPQQQQMLLSEEIYKLKER